MTGFVPVLLELALLIAAGAGLGFGFGYLEGGFSERDRVKLRWVGGFAAVWFVVMGLFLAGLDGPVLHGLVGVVFLAMLGFATVNGPSSLSLIRRAGLGGTAILLVNGLIFTAVLSGMLLSVGIDQPFRSWQTAALYPLGVFVAVRVHGLRNLALEG